MHDADFTGGDMGAGHASDSAVARRVEEHILRLASEELHFELKHRVWTEARTTLPDGARIDVDGYCPDPLTYAEVFARQGKLKGGQIHKVAQDVLKLVTVRKLLAPNAQLYVVFADKSAAAILDGRGWLAEAAHAWDVKPLVVRLDTKLRGELNKAQDRQRMINPPQH